MVVLCFIPDMCCLLASLEACECIYIYILLGIRIGLSDPQADRPKFWISQFVRKNFEKYEVQVLFFLIPFIVFALLFSLPLTVVVAQIWGHILVVVSSPPLMRSRILEILLFCHEGKAQIVQTNEGN